MAPLVHRQSNPKNERHIEGTVIILFNKSKVVIVQANMIRVKIVKQARVFRVKKSRPLLY